MQGFGVLQDYTQAYFWFSLSGPNGNAPEAKEHLTTAQIREVERLINQWNEQHVLRPDVAAALQIMETNSR